MSSCFALALVLGTVGCKHDAATGATGSGSGSGSGSATPAPAPAPAAEGTVTILVNDKQVARLAPKDLDAWPRLDTLVPVEARRIGSWTTVVVTAASAKPLEISRPGDRYRDQVIALYVDHGSAAFGVFDPVELAKRGAPTIKETGLRTIAITADTAGGRGQNESGAGGGGDPTKLVIAIKSPKGETKVTGEQLLKLPREDMPGGDTQGWKLSAILAAAQIGPYKKLVLADDKGTALSLDKAEFDDRTVIPFIKLNKQGQLRLKIYKQQGTGWQSIGDLRNLTSIDVK
ncbi:MAG: hypothetical protein NT062_30225 [Proteobacteria bacterium]|nr:hypothetical protein [Pseudomonadota bacterium]